MGLPAQSIDWIAEARSAGVVEVARALGGPTPPRGGDPRRVGLGPCPACNAPTRHTKAKDKRGALGLTPDGLGWRCFQCEKSGDAITLASYLAGAGGEVRGEAATKTREALELAGLVAPAGQPRPARRAPPKRARALKAAPASPPPPKYPPIDEVQALLGFSVEVDQDTAVSLFLSRKGNRGEGIDVGRLVDVSYSEPIARVVPANARALPRWARHNRKSWAETSHRLFTTMVDAGGVVRSVHARAIEEETDPKTLSPAGFQVRELVMADSLARLMLAGDPIGRELVAESGLVIVEGLTDFLTQCTKHSDANEHAPATIGVISGAWGPSFASKVPPGTTVLIATDRDPTGEKYAEGIAATFKDPTVMLRRWKPADERE